MAHIKNRPGSGARRLATNRTSRFEFEFLARFSGPSGTDLPTQVIYAIFMAAFNVETATARVSNQFTALRGASSVLNTAISPINGGERKGPNTLEWPAISKPISYN